MRRAQCLVRVATSLRGTQSVTYPCSVDERKANELLVYVDALLAGAENLHTMRGDRLCWAGPRIVANSSGESELLAMARAVSEGLYAPPHETCQEGDLRGDLRKDRHGRGGQPRPLRGARELKDAKSTNIEGVKPATKLRRGSDLALCSCAQNLDGMRFPTRRRISQGCVNKSPFPARLRFHFEDCV